MATAILDPAPRRWVRRFWGLPDLPTRQKWAAVWPVLRDLPLSGLTVLDAGSFRGGWTLDLAALRPGWRLIGVDFNAAAVEQARDHARLLGLSNVRFTASDFRDYAPPAPVDVVLSIASAHYLVEAGEGEALFRRFAEWLKPGGMLLLLGPRREMEVPFLAGLPRPGRRDVYAQEQLQALCTAAGLKCESCQPVGGPLATVARQATAWVGTRSLMMRAMSYPARWAAISLDAFVSDARRDGSMYWLLQARRPADSRAK